MAWPCISRVCCLARFWSQLDRSDLSVPLSTQSYSAISEPEPEPEHRAPRSGRAPAADQRTSRAGRDAVFEARDECRPPGGPFHCVTRYKEDFQPWPVPRKETFPWIGEGRRHERLPEGPQYPGDSAQEPGGTGARSTNAYGQEHRPWMGARPPKLAQKEPVNMSSTMTEFRPETSYQAAFSGDTFKQMEILQVDPTGGQRHRLPERPQLRHGARGEEQVVKTKLSPNSSAIFQSGSRIFNI
ncbi:MAP6 domain-containing protein 1 isoform X1 [Scleropages formosus]|uniref:MAP6 domain-containing protein 1 isoform X1 n=1 Tax=Scleropages formosus TaxID=113540 RepID=UPI0010FA85C0|nr:MAP6 domain-containing protein 1 isoform X1 [Scleropages formosus]